MVGPKVSNITQVLLYTLKVNVVIDIRGSNIHDVVLVSNKLMQVNLY